MNDACVSDAFVSDAEDAGVSDSHELNVALLCALNRLLNVVVVAHSSGTCLTGMIVMGATASLALS